jgi:hypothetical protein
MHGRKTWKFETVGDLSLYGKIYVMLQKYANERLREFRWLRIGQGYCKPTREEGGGKN